MPHWYKQRERGPVGPRGHELLADSVVGQEQRGKNERRNCKRGALAELTEAKILLQNDSTSLRLHSFAAHDAQGHQLDGAWPVRAMSMAMCPTFAPVPVAP